jgi:hypothetical protein
MRPMQRSHPLPQLDNKEGWKTNTLQSLRTREEKAADIRNMADLELCNSISAAIDRDEAEH